MVKKIPVFLKHKTDVKKTFIKLTNQEAISAIEKFKQINFTYHTKTII